ncbi:AMP-binding protein [Prevotella sp. HUN102]|uniref:AMP-binding protein n=1 Tax=Prevotella sp. HUN102 TaxID=1392486 RepID=UPI000490E175|nr:AMP-binding protein [Prevotella sp. HUN102]
MDSIPSFNSYIENSIKDNWEKDALTDYHGATLQYHDVARKIEKLHILFEYSGLKKGDKVGLCGRNSSMWAVCYLATLTYGAVAVPIQNEFTPEQVYNIVNHSESRLLFVGDVVAPTLDAAQMPNLEGIIYIPDLSLVMSRSEQLTYARENLNAIFGQKFPKYFHKEHVSYHIDCAEELALINYTSGTTGFSKGVMIPYRALWSNLDWANSEFGVHIPKHSNILCTLPMAHMYGMTCEFIFNICFGNHLFFLTRLPSPTLISEACSEVKPAMVVAVPLVVDKIIRKKIFPQIDNRATSMLLKMPVINKKIKEKIRNLVMEAFGGNAYQVMTGGAALNKEIEDFLTSIDFPVNAGYGTTETAPMITYSDQSDFVGGSCGTIVKHMEMKILSSDPKTIPGEIIARGLNVMQGYFKNEEATKAVLDSDGWYHTGDLATMDETGHVFIRGRIKNMLLGANGQNIYPEEIEDKLNSMAMVSESLIIQNGDKLIGLVVPDMEEASSMGFSEEDLQSIMEENRNALNQILPTFCKISTIRIQQEEFKKTPKKSIKRYLYQNAEV